MTPMQGHIQSIVDSYLNGQLKQLREQFKEMLEDWTLAEFINSARDLELDDSLTLNLIARAGLYE